MRLLVGAYPSDSRLEALDEIAERTGCDGFEIPFGSGYVADEQRMLARLAASGRHVLTLLPATMAGGFGLASPDESRRRRAVNLVERARTAAVGVGTVEAVLLHSAPRVDVARLPEHRAALAASLAEIGEWEWCGVDVVLEHCDSYAGPTPLKGFLDLPSELESGLDVAINWGRSYLDTGRMDGPAEHARLAADAGRLRILGVSGVASGDWADAHAPVGAGLLSATALADFVATGDVPTVVVKVGGGLDAVVESVRATQKALARASVSAPH
ncbi:DUF4862 family protein [Microbacteriaceae bacterium VKM Ac-2855]|nr:DUF4862 family protein [Microbacteriaceae bacterium VKM Ac-2855]